MKGKVVHIPDDVHGALKQHCTDLGKSMTEVVVELVLARLSGANNLPPPPKPAPVEGKKRLRAISVDEKEPPVYSLPPFWEMRRKSRETENDQHEGTDCCQSPADQGAEVGRVRSEEDRLRFAENIFRSGGAEGGREEGEEQLSESFKTWFQERGGQEELVRSSEGGSSSSDEDILVEEEKGGQEGSQKSGENPRIRSG